MLLKKTIRIYYQTDRPYPGGGPQAGIGFLTVILRETWWALGVFPVYTSDRLLSSAATDP